MKFKRWSVKYLVCTSILFTTLSLVMGCSANKAGGGADDSYVLVNELEFINQTLEQRSEGNYIYQAQIKNNSKFIIRGISIDIELSNGNYTTISTQDTLKSGDISGFIQCFGPSSGRIEDMKATRILINMYDENMVHTVVEYDVNQNKYTYTPGEAFSAETPKVTMTDLEFMNPTLTVPSNASGSVFETSLKNNSDYAIMGLVYTFEMNNGKNVNLMVVDTIGARESIGPISCTGPESGNMEDMETKTIKYTIIDEKGTSQTITYDVRLNQYFIK